jgi:acyl-CoA dehydrogenase
MTYQPPVSEILLAMKVTGGLGPDLSLEDAQTIIAEAGRLAADIIAPLNRVGDKHPAKVVDGVVSTPPGWTEAYKAWCEGGWNALTGPQEFGGQGLPMVMAVATAEMLNAACLSFALCPLLTNGAIEAINAHASDELKQRYLPKMITGEWTGTMNLTEPQSGSDLSTLRTKARRESDSTYRITGQKIYITYGEHEMTSNIVHLVLARLEGAPEGTRGISLFLVPKVLPDGARNDLRCHALEHKLGIHGSPTCTMIYGDNGGATGWLVGEENRGLNCMFTMMNNARLLVGVQGVAVAERAYQAALAFARERKQGRSARMTTGSSAIIEHPDVKRMLLDIRSKTAAARMLCMATATAIDQASTAMADDARRIANARASLLTPLAKAYSTDISVEVASAAVQICGGMGFVEETGVAQYYRDARILPIYEGTNGIQAIDLVTRKLQIDNGATLAELIAESAENLSKRLGSEKTSSLSARLVAMVQKLNTDKGQLASATPFLRALSTFAAAGLLAKSVELTKDTLFEQQTLAELTYYCNVELAAALATAEGMIESAALMGTF